jgi:hypothetical protein
MQVFEMVNVLFSFIKTKYEECIMLLKTIQKIKE